MLKLKGRSVVFGHVCGPAFVYQQNIGRIPSFSIVKEQIPAEWLKFEKARYETREQLLACKAKAQQLDYGDKSVVFDIQVALLDDSYVLQELKKELQNSLKNIAFCLDKVIKKCSQQFQHSASLCVRERYFDLKDVGDRLMQILLEQPCKQKQKKGVLVAESLGPSDVISLNKEDVLGIVLENSCTTSHALILAKGLRVPIVVGVEGACEKINTNDLLELNGESGEVFVNPDNVKFFDEKTPKVSGRPVLVDGESVDFYWVYDGIDSKNTSKDLPTQGIGLVRSEMLLAGRNDFPKEEEQFLFYKNIVEQTVDGVVVLRTWDIGGDKKLDLQGQLHEENPFLGVRGIRYCLENEAVFKSQLLAMLRASAFGKTQILYPMISCVEELIQANKILEECKNHLHIHGVPFDTHVPVGIMVEVPGVALALDLFAPHCDFFSLGTNDLVQYTLAVDRTNDNVAKLYQMTHPAILRILMWVYEQAKNTGKKIFVCGEMPNSIVPLLMCLGIGYRNFTVCVQNFSSLIAVLHKVNLSRLKDALKQALEKEKAEDIFELFEKII